MKILLVSDIHANLPALQAVLDGALFRASYAWETRPARPDAASCLAELRNLEKTLEFSAILSGNHDALLSGHLSSHGLISRPPRSEGHRPDAGPGCETVGFGTLSSKDISGSVRLHGSPLEPLTGYPVGGIETAEVSNG